MQRRCRPPRQFRAGTASNRGPAKFHHGPARTVATARASLRSEPSQGLGVPESMPIAGRETTGGGRNVVGPRWREPSFFLRLRPRRRALAPFQTRSGSKTADAEVGRAPESPRSGAKDLGLVSGHRERRRPRGGGGGRAYLSNPAYKRGLLTSMPGGSAGGTGHGKADRSPPKRMGALRVPWRPIAIRWLSPPARPSGQREERFAIDASAAGRQTARRLRRRHGGPCSCWKRTANDKGPVLRNGDPSRTRLARTILLVLPLEKTAGVGAGRGACNVDETHRSMSSIRNSGRNSPR